MQFLLISVLVCLVQASSIFETRFNNFRVLSDILTAQYEKYTYILTGSNSTEPADLFKSYESFN